MFSFVLKKAQGLVSYVSGGQKETEEEQIARMEAAIADEDDELTKEEELRQLQAQQQVVPTNCSEQTGKVTKVEADYIVIDDSLFVKKHVLQDCKFRQQLEVGSKVSYMTFKPTGDEEVRVTNLIKLQEESWGEGKQTTPATIDEENNALLNELPQKYFKTTQRSENGKVTSKRFGLLTVETDHVKTSVELNNIKMTFIPEKGDFVVLDCQQQIDEEYLDFRGNILEVHSIRPTKRFRGTGTVSRADAEGGKVETENDEFIYLIEVCEPGATPGVGDKVLFEAVENESFKRCISVVIDQVAPPMVLKPSGNEGIDQDMFLDKRGIRVTDNLRIVLADIGHRECIDVVLENNAKHQHKLLRAVFISAKRTSQMQLVQPKQPENIFLQPGEKVKFTFEVTAQNLGASVELYKWNFGGGFNIVRRFEILVGPDADVSALPIATGTMNARSKAGTDKLAAWNVYKRGGEVTPGQKISKRANFIDIKIGSYHVPDEIKQILLNPTFNRDQIDDELKQSQRCLQRGLGPETYKSMYKLFLWMEDVQSEISITRFNMDRAHFTREDSYLALRMENIGETRPSLIPGDRLIASTPWLRQEEVSNGAFIHKVLRHKILVKFSEHFHEKYNGEDYKVIFQHARGAFQKQHHAINCVTSAMGIDYLFPTKAEIREPWMDVELNDNGNLATVDFNNEFQWVNRQLNDIQKLAIKNILRAETRPSPYIIFGPPGTGKTMTLIELIHQIVKLGADSRIMVGTPSNSSANLITERIIESKVLRPGEFIRIVGLNYVEQELIPEKLAPHCATVDIASERTVKSEVITTASGLKHKLQLKHLGRHRITIGTCVTLGTLMHMRFDKNHFTHILIDEAGQCLETETLIPLTFINKHCGTVVLAGDPMQLGPVVMSQHAKGFEQSLLVRLMDTPLYKPDRIRFPDTGGFNPRLVTKLRYNYRSLPSILNLYSDMFYDGSLIPCVAAEGTKEASFLDSIYDILPVKPNPKCGFIFWGIDGVNKQTPESPSWFNPQEANSLFNFLLKLYKKEVSPEDIGIIAPYQQQVKLIRRLLDEASSACGTQTIQRPKIGSVEEFQGQERMVILISTVRSSQRLLASDKQHALGFVADSKRLNVAISRAKALLVVFGNPHLLAVDKQWRQLICTAVENGAYCGTSLPESLAYLQPNEGDDVNGNEGAE